MADNNKKLTILHSNDLHGDFLAENVDDRLIGGVSRLSGYVNRTRGEEANTIYCIAGDMFRGSVIDSEFRGVSTIEIMNMLSPDVVAIGNHETDYGIAHLLFWKSARNSRSSTPICTSRPTMRVCSSHTISSKWTE